MIESFKDEYRWLSNFQPCIIHFHELHFPSVEHAYVFAKNPWAFSSEDYDWFVRLTARQAKKVGRNMDILPDWDRTKYNTMLTLTRQKYSGHNPRLRDLLVVTQDRYIQEGNTWGDRYWGVCDGIGCNNLGKIIMQVRKEIS